jgi:hypothetical protein
MREGAQVRLLDRALPRREDHTALVVKIADAKLLAHRLARLELNEVRERTALRRSLHLRDVVNLQPVDLAAVGKEQDVVVR